MFWDSYRKGGGPAYDCLMIFLDLRGLHAFSPLPMQEVSHTPATKFYQTQIAVV